MRQVVTCHCGAAYERTETLLIFWVADDFFCRDCGEVLEIVERFADPRLHTQTWSRAVQGVLFTGKIAVKLTKDHDRNYRTSARSV